MKTWIMFIVLFKAVKTKSYLYYADVLMHWITPWSARGVKGFFHQQSLCKEYIHMLTHLAESKPK